GEFFLDETAVHHLKSKERATLRNEQVGFVFQQYHLLDDLTVYENLDIPLSYRHYSKSERAALVADALDRFQIVGKKDLYPRQLSGGQQQLVGVARAIIASPKLLLADAGKNARICHHCCSHPCSRHRRKQRHFQRGRCRLVAATALSAGRSARFRVGPSQTRRGRSANRFIPELR